MASQYAHFLSAWNRRMDASRQCLMVFFESFWSAIQWLNSVWLSLVTKFRPSIRSVITDSHCELANLISPDEQVNAQLLKTRSLNTDERCLHLRRHLQWDHTFIWRISVDNIHWIWFQDIYRYVSRTVGWATFASLVSSKHVAIGESRSVVLNTLPCTDGEHSTQWHLLF